MTDPETIQAAAAVITGKAYEVINGTHSAMDPYEIAQALARAGLLRDDPLDFTPLMEVGEIPEIATQILHVDIDALALLDHFDDDEAKTFDMLAKLKDLLTT